MKILFIGDVMGRSGREALETHLPVACEKYSPDVVIVNGENAANGAGITEKICKGFYDLGVHVITTGNHVWDQREVIPYIERDKTLLRPLNFPAGTPGNGFVDHTLEDGRVLRVINAMGRLFVDDLDDPFRALDSVLEDAHLGKNVHAVLVDFHAETTSEKMSLGHYLDGRVSAVVGTHTHIPTADAHVMEHGTAYMTDAGMTGDYNSVIGVVKNIAINRFLKKVPSERMKPASGVGMMCGCLIETDDITGLARNIQPVRMGAILQESV